MSDIPQVAIDRAVETVSRLELMLAAYDEGYGHGLEAGVQAERERIEKEVRHLHANYDDIDCRSLDAFLAVVSGDKEGASDE